MGRLTPDGTHLKIGLDLEDVRVLSVRITHIEALRGEGSAPPASQAGRDRCIRPKRVIRSDFGDVAACQADLSVTDTVTLDGWEFNVGLEARFTFGEEVSRWQLEGRDTRRILVGLCLPHSCEVIAYLTAKVGMRPLILPPAVPDE
jgi:hypothetical protein